MSGTHHKSFFVLVNSTTRFCYPYICIVKLFQLTAADALRKPDSIDVALERHTLRLGTNLSFFRLLTLGAERRKLHRQRSRRSVLLPEPPVVKPHTRQSMLHAP